MAESTQVPLSPLEQANSAFQVQWNKLMQDDSKFAGIYQNVAVLLISWADELDDLHCGDEVGRLQNVFQNKYNYKVSRLVIDRKDAPQLQVNYEMSRFMLQEDSEGSLLIIYYAGHGMPGTTPGQLKLIGKRDPDARSLTDFEVVWSFTDGILQNARSDVFVIFDCCFASHLARNSHLSPRSYEFLSPNHLGPLTPVPGPGSFTECLIWALEKLFKECKSGFNTQQLRTKIAQHSEWPKQQSPFLYEPYGSSMARIFLAPLPKMGCQATKEQQPPHRPVTDQISLELRVLFNCTPDEHDIEFLAVNWKKVMKRGLPKARTIRWGGLRQGPQGMSLAANRFLQIVQQVRERQQPLTRLTGDLTTGVPGWSSKVQPMGDSSINEESEILTNLQKESSESAVHSAQSHVTHTQTQPQLKLTVDIPSPDLELKLTAVRSQEHQSSKMKFRTNTRLVTPKEKDSVFVKRLKVTNDNGFKKMTSTWDGPYTLYKVIRRQRYALLTRHNEKQVVGQYPTKHLRVVS